MLNIGMSQVGSSFNQEAEAMKRKQQRKPNLNKRQLNCLKNRVLTGQDIPLGVTYSLIKKGYLVEGLYYNDKSNPWRLVPLRLPTDKARALIARLWPKEYFQSDFD